MTEDSNIPELHQVPDDGTQERWGAVAIIDALGFRGKWKDREKASMLASKMLQMRQLAQNWRASRPAPTEIGNVEPPIVQAISDTFIVASTIPIVGVSDLWKVEAIVETISAVQQLFEVGLSIDPPLAFRGCISVGSVWTCEDVIIGPAIDEAAEWYEEAECAAVWLTPKANNLAKLVNHSAMSVDVFDWRVPLHGGRTVYTSVVNCTRTWPFWDRVDSLRATLLNTFGDSPEVWFKRENTEALIDAAIRHTTEVPGG